MNKIIFLVRKYLPDILIFSGILIFSYNYLRYNAHIYVKDYYLNYKILGIVILTIGIIIAVRRYFTLKK